jgi:DHA1 family bicyclomycin/chloramphenicol resistance-like MFS transporter
MNRVELKYLLLITIIFVAACIETDIYLPAFADMMRFFQTSEEAIQSLLTWNFVGVCVSGPLYGPLSDAFGRKRPLLAALGIFFAGSVLTLFAPSFDLMLWGRLLQGIGSGGCFTLGTAIIFDAFQKERAIWATSMLNSTFPFIMALAPMLGGILNHWWGFRANFLCIAIFVFISLAISVVSFEETLPIEKRSPFKMRKIARDFKEVFTSLPFWAITVSISLLFAGYLVFLAGTALLFVLEFGVSRSLFPFFQAAVLAAWLIASLTCSRSVTKWGTPKVKRVGGAMIVGGALGLAAAGLLFPENPYLLTLFMMIYAAGVNWVQGFYFPEGMELHPEIKGIAASVLTSARLLIAAVVVGLSAKLYNGTAVPIWGVIVAIVIVSTPIMLYYERRSGAEMAIGDKNEL